MNSLRLALALLVATVLASSASARVGNSRYHSAKCLAMKNKCGSELQRQSGACKARTFARAQSKACVRQACAWCKVRGKASIYPCSASNVRAICAAHRRGGSSGGDSKPKPMPKAPRPPTRPPPTSPSRNGGSAKPGCTWMGGDKVVVDLSKVKPGKGWTPVSRGGLKGLIYEKSKTHGIDGAGSGGKMCFKVKASMNGDYLFTVVSAAPHGTEHNDLWAASSKGFLLRRNANRGGTQSARPGEYKKGYQNNGGLKLADYLCNVDRDCHVFVVTNVEAGKAFEICLRGRSYKYEVFKAVLAKCNVDKCASNRPRRGSLVRAPPSRCM